jgi:hypothetical protein
MRRRKQFEDEEKEREKKFSKKVSETENVIKAKINSWDWLDV